jgi:hypothetical protein
MRCRPSSTSSTSRGCSSWGWRWASAWVPGRHVKRWSGGSGSGAGDLRILALVLLLSGACQAGPGESAPGADHPPEVIERAPSRAESVPPAPGARGGPAPEIEPEPAPTPPLPMLGAKLDQDALLAMIEDAPVRSFEPVGRTSVVFRMELAAEVDAAFKPRTRQHPWGFRAEVAAYRVARLLEMDNVPPAVTRRVSAGRIRDRLHPDFHDAWEEIAQWTLWDPDGTVAGAAIYWIPRMRNLGLEQPGGIGRLRRWLAQGGAIPGEHEELASDASTMVAFDYLIGNWDRWSGGNVQGTASGGRLFIRDHNVAFASPLPTSLHRRVRDHLTGAQRFSRSFVESVARLDADALRAELAQDPGHAAGDAILSDVQIADLMDRRRALLSYVGALVEAHGEERVLVFP